MKALILAAGSGERLGGGGEQPPKSLLRFEDRSLLERHLEILFELGIERVTIGIGYRGDMIQAELARLQTATRVDTVYNPEFERGNIVTLWRMRERLVAGGEVLLMDADVLYDHRIMRRLVDSAHESCLLLDRNIEPGDEPVKVCVRDRRIVEFGKRIQAHVPYDYHGESVGFFKLGEDVARELAATSQAYVDAGNLDAFYEDALRELLLADTGECFGVEDISGLPWIEIDYMDDIARARRDVLPRLPALPACANKPALATG